ncbi:hypothetical protein [Paraburkholderia tropica]|uniref:Uncharacterized protein n=1 Tax=Paraburkholderia tropica TaxID=92647 RepID=A0AAQ1JU79_9BURK|nr:hypothetical protein [Paraburkholderia tropica]MBB2979754.1 hypothetical protein [Paraburkholderia tropica]MDE1143767.1 hypothetical protein [Paraburkholderia tropica]PXX16982.1 hypothetical protein C7400_107191 [Paraburkholderia tropica]PZW83875.1 hypothetical protein C7399_107123 [Paraburkholderia tropica]QNB15778.1 hypothetical protein G5S35_29865 [Paraburkholderia tropica]
MIMTCTSRRLLATVVIASIGIVPVYGQTGSPGMKQMQDAQRKAGEKARTSKHSQDANSGQQKDTGGSVPASSPGQSH